MRNPRYCRAPALRGPLFFAAFFFTALTVSFAAPAAMLRAVSTAVFCVTSFMALAAISWNWLVSAPHHCIGSTAPAAPPAELAGLADFPVALRTAEPAASETAPAAAPAFCAAPATVSAVLSLSALA